MSAEPFTIEELADKRAAVARIGNSRGSTARWLATLDQLGELVVELRDRLAALDDRVSAQEQDLYWARAGFRPTTHAQ